MTTDGKRAETDMNDAPTPTPAAVVIAHDKPRQLRRLIDAIDPMPVFLHVDANTPAALYEQMTADLPERVRLLPRQRCGWATYGVLAAELQGYRAALEHTDAAHIALLSGADYPLASTRHIEAALAARAGRSFVEFFRLPQRRWPPLAGYDRFYFRNWPWRRRRLLLPIPRRVPAGLRPAGGSPSKILARGHAERLLAVLDARPEIERFFRRAWAPDEVLVPTVLTSPAVSPGWENEVAGSAPAFFIDWGVIPKKNPPWLGPADFDRIAQAARRTDSPALFARKFADDADEITGRIDAELRGG